MDKWDVWSEPTNVVLAISLLATGYVIMKAQSSGKFDFGEMLRDEAGRASSSRVIALGAFSASTWVLMRYTTTNAITDWIWWGYLAAWSGSAVLSKAIDAWRGVRIETKGE
jgi:hypothetical protein